MLEMSHEPRILLSVLDAMGKPDSGILEGSIVWLGSFGECIDVRATETLPDNNTEYLFSGKYCLTVFRPSGPVVQNPVSKTTLTDFMQSVVVVCVVVVCLV